ncbi:hypothetical protein C5167_037560 [Papaver somniferum]|uniref:Uncharacterized protein n=1 Tax=Papaver somniferum TaxID=3469 RepID=A0A4Y7IAF2_PAPSO|nr:hypothetical protein C5167_037560 [Papaver somniferum]
MILISTQIEFQFGFTDTSPLSSVRAIGCCTPRHTAQILSRIIASRLDIRTAREARAHIAILRELLPNWMTEEVASNGYPYFCIHATESRILAKYRDNLAENLLKLKNQGFLSYSLKNTAHSWSKKFRL